MCLGDILELCKRYQDLDSNAQEMLDGLADMSCVENHEKKALRYVRSFLKASAAAGIEDAREILEDLGIYCD